MTLLRRVLNDPTLKGESLLSPINYFSNKIRSSKSDVSEAFDECATYRKYKNLIPAHGQKTVMKAQDLACLSINKDGTSDSLFFKHDTFEVTALPGGKSYEVIRRRDPAFQNHSYRRILFNETVSRIIKSIGWIALAILVIPFLLPVGAIALCQKAADLRTRRLHCQRPLIVEELPLNKKEYQQVADIAHLWEREGGARKTQIADKTEKEVFASTESVCRALASCLENSKESKPYFDSMYICSDVEHKRPQAIALTKTTAIWKRSRKKLGNYLKLSYLASNPDNIRSKLNEHIYTRVEGAGKKTLFHLLKIAKDKSLKGVYLEAVESAVPFYKRFGFKPLNPKVVKMSEKNLQPMHITQDAIRQLAL